MSALLSAQNLAVRIGSSQPLEDVSFEIDEGQSLGIVGETGSGKSLTCRAVLGLLPRIGGEISAGKLTYTGVDLGNLDEREWRNLRGREIAYIPQASMSALDPVARVGRQLSETIRLLEGRMSVRERSMEILEQVRMPRIQEVIRSYPHELSGGMRQRVMIGMALIGKPRLLIADEPTTALDVTVQRRILDLMRTLCRSEGMALILVSHDLGVVRSTCESLAVMYNGRTVEAGPVSSVEAAPAHPYTQALLGADLSRATKGRPLTSLPSASDEITPAAAACSFARRCRYVVDTCCEREANLRPLADRADHSSACWRRRTGEI